MVDVSAAHRDISEGWGAAVSRENVILRSSRIELGIVLIIAAGFLSLCIKQTPNYNFTLLADSFLHGHIWVVWPGSIIDAVLYRGQYFVIEGPAPALLTMPLVAIMGPAGWTQEVASLVAGLASVALFWLMFKRMGLGRADRLWMVAFVFLGTDLYWCSVAAGVWFFSVVVSCALTAATFCEVIGRRRGWLIGLLAVVAVGTRFTMLPVLLLYPYLLWIGAFNSRIGIRRTLAQYAVIVAIGSVAWVAYNEARWGTPYDIGYNLFCTTDQMCANGLFGIKYLGYELYSFFLRAPDLKVNSQLVTWPYLGVSFEGMALTFTSPALVFAYWARCSRTVAALWATTILIAIPSLLYYVNGFLQVGMRHALDFEPFLFVLMALAIRDNARRWVYVLISISVAVSSWQVWYWWAWMPK